LKARNLALRQENQRLQGTLPLTPTFNLKNNTDMKPLEHPEIEQLHLQNLDLQQRLKDTQGKTSNSSLQHDTDVRNENR
jgi:hypothetical protein